MTQEEKAREIARFNICYIVNKNIHCITNKVIL